MFSRALTTNATSRVLAHPNNASPILSLNTPLTRGSILRLKDTLDKAYKEQPIIQVDARERHAAVLISLCNVEDKPGILLEVRGQLRTHAGETDQSFLAAALRETHEEVGIPPKQIEILGQVGPAELSLGGLRVWPYVGFIYPSAEARAVATSVDADPDAPLPSLPMSSLKISHPEVAHAFHLPFSSMISPTRLCTHLFRGGAPYWAITVSDLVSEKNVDWANDPKSTDEVGGGRGGRLEVWGLTGWYLSLFMKWVLSVVSTPVHPASCLTPPSHLVSHAHIVLRLQGPVSTLLLDRDHLQPSFLIDDAMSNTVINKTYP
ncbi:hypothetical protein EVG20_g5030 [Dentipellis fragilis]|uniref:Nudix hydrolase domain-containing protein n=1 Tax=Dentipellis fragilis TaxID=205917 RepID=A0A4Y9YWF2_9AGAM|nr:hypothetical protein EVG20_g5030 [Dentipellis fragilis]